MSTRFVWVRALFTIVSRVAKLVIKSPQVRAFATKHPIISAALTWTALEGAQTTYNVLMPEKQKTIVYPDPSDPNRPQKNYFRLFDDETQFDTGLGIGCEPEMEIQINPLDIKSKSGKIGKYIELNFKKSGRLTCEAYFNGQDNPFITQWANTITVIGTDDEPNTKYEIWEIPIQEPVGLVYHYRLYVSDTETDLLRSCRIKQR